MTRALITGAAGGVGVHFIAHFMHETNWHLVVLDSFRHKGYKDRIKRVCKFHPEWWDRLTVIQHDLVCPISPEMEERIGKVDYIFHLAAMADVFWGQENRRYVVQNNIEATLTMLEYARKIRPKLFLYFSTDEVYGPVKKGGAHKEWETHRPSNYYAASKAACEDICYAAWRSDDLPLIITNTMNNFGEMQAPSKFPAMVQRLVQRGETVIVHGNKKEVGTRFYIHSRNVADAVLFIIKKFPVYHHKIGEIDQPRRFHIVGEVNWDNLTLAKKIAAYMGKPLKFKLVDFHKKNPAHDIHYGLFDSFLRPAGWKPRVDTETGLKNTIDWQQGKEDPPDVEWLEA